MKLIFQELKTFKNIKKKNYYEERGLICWYKHKSKLKIVEKQMRYKKV